ncbi:MAG: hypothetical protein AB2L20_14985 [Mangrovibacterium sp.]
MVYVTVHPGAFLVLKDEFAARLRRMRNLSIIIIEVCYFSLIVLY